MIAIAEGDIFDSNAEILVNPVNCVGVSGAGLALLFKVRFPCNQKMYELACRNGIMRPGEIIMHLNSYTFNPRFIFNFPTKMHWRNRSELLFISQGLEDLTAKLHILRVKSIAIPALGCGFGQLSWSEVEPLIRQAFESLPDVKVLLYPPRD
jgi:O-acetyl-ADP-ribose deacetylase (regulator of RNase III)